MKMTVMKMRVTIYLWKEGKLKKTNGHQNQDLNWKNVQVVTLWRGHQGHGSSHNLAKKWDISIFIICKWRYD